MQPVCGDDKEAWTTAHDKELQMKYKTFLKMTPPTATAQHKGSRIAFVNGRLTIVHYIKKQQKLAHDQYVKLLKADIQNRKNKDGIGTTFMFTTPVVVRIDFLFPNPSNTAKKNRDKTFAKVTRPDVDNMAKGLLDCLSEVGLLQDDAIIFDLRLRKFTVAEWRQGVRISITDELDGYTMNDGDNEKE